MAVEYIDYTVFLGLNAVEEPVRLACKALVASRLPSAIHMTWDHVGRCDHTVWQHSRALQDRYYPFMDELASHAFLQREGYLDSTLRLAAFDERLRDVPVLHRLLVARALERQGTVFTLAPELAGRADLPVLRPPAALAEVEFPAWLEPLYQDSLALRIELGEEEALACTAG
jgi:hypothetical protein